MNEINIDRHKKKPSCFISSTLPLMWEMLFHINIRRSCLLSANTSTVPEFVSFPPPEDTGSPKNHPVKATFGIFHTVFSLAYLCSSLSLITSNLYVFSFLVSSPKASCCFHRPLPLIAFPCPIPQLGLMLLMNLTFLFPGFYFQITRLQGKADRPAFLLLWIILSLPVTLFSISLCLQHTSFDELCY